jgi:hypothetical protein
LSKFCTHGQTFAHLHIKFILIYQYINFGTILAYTISRKNNLEDKIMRKLILVALVAVFALTSVTAFAQGRGMMGGGFGGGFGMGGGMGGCGGCYGNQFANNMTEDQAKVAIEAYVAQYFKGYKLGKMTTAQMPRGSYFVMEATDAGGNKFNFFATPCGNVRGPMPAQF